MRRVLVIAYYFPPMGLSGVQRIAKFVKYLPHYGWQPTVLTVYPGKYFAYDTSLLREVEASGAEIIRTATLDPLRLLAGTQGQLERPLQMPSERLRRLWNIVNGWLFVPDNKIGWLPLAVRAGEAMLKQHRFEVLFASSPPPTALLIGARLQQKSHLPFVVDYRDDWLENPRQLFPTRWHRWLHARLERYVLRRATCAITINTTLARQLSKRLPGDKGAPIVIPHGFDPEDFENAPILPRSPKRLCLLYAGVFYDAQQPDDFFQGLAQWLGQQPEAREHVEAVFIGLQPPHVPQRVAQLGLNDIVRFEGYRSHPETIAALKTADVLWMTVGEQPGAAGISTSKLFEYIGSRKPILALVPEGEARTLLQEYGAAYLAPPHDVPAIACALARIYTDWKAQRLPEGKAEVVNRHSRRLLTRHLAEVFTMACRRHEKLLTHAVSVAHSQ